MSAPFELLGSEMVWQGRIASVHVDRFRHADGEEVERERVGHPGAVAMVAHDGERVWMVRQPREAVREPGLLELPAGKLDVAGEPMLETAKRELAEEIGKTARRWRHLVSFWSSPGFSDERIHVFEATELKDIADPRDVEEDERIEVVPWPLDRLDELIDACQDSKSLVGLLLLRRTRGG
jgi:8-oxo-dGTP pyrophosphatase MutT (NUDIX family)